RVRCGVCWSLNLRPVGYDAFVYAPFVLVGGGCVDCVVECECSEVGVSVADCVFDHSPIPSSSIGLVLLRCSRWSMSGRYVSSASIPIELNPAFRAASRVVSDPAKGSSTVPLGGVTSRISHCMIASGLTVGCWTPSAFGRSDFGAFAQYKNLDAPPLSVWRPRECGLSSDASYRARTRVAVSPLGVFSPAAASS